MRTCCEWNGYEDSFFLPTPTACPSKTSWNERAGMMIIPDWLCILQLRRGTSVSSSGESDVCQDVAGTLFPALASLAFTFSDCLRIRGPPPRYFILPGACPGRPHFKKRGDPGCFLRIVPEALRGALPSELHQLFGDIDAE